MEAVGEGDAPTAESMLDAPPFLLARDISGSPKSRIVGTWHNTVLTVAAASVAPIVYLLFIDRYATNAFYGDDWSVAPLVDGALHGHFSLGQLWNQYNESRLFMGNVVEVLFGLVDRLDLRSVIFFSVALLIASYGFLLVLVRGYLGRSLAPIPVLVIGAIWFSLADVQNALWAFQVSWYLTVFFFVLMLFALFIPENRRMLWFAVGTLVALAASLSTIQGFICWPLGVICILSGANPGRAAPSVNLLHGRVPRLSALSCTFGDTAPVTMAVSGAALQVPPCTIP